MKSIEKLTFCVLIGSLLLSQSVLANQTDLTAKVKDCSKVSDDQARLACFDQLIVKQDHKVQAPTTKVLEKELTAKQVDAFSKEQIKKTDKETANEIKSITLIISKLEKNPRGKWKITFDNGQKWQQKDSKGLKLNEGDTVILTKGALSSVFLQKENTSKRIKVKRLK
jgi:hypothetical protein